MTAVAERPTEGEALERSSFTSLFTKVRRTNTDEDVGVDRVCLHPSNTLSTLQDWNNCYWVMQGNLLLLYANKEMYLRVRKSQFFLPHIHTVDL